MERQEGAINPITGYAKQSAGEKDGKGKSVLHILYPTKDTRLWGHEIPQNVDAQDYLEKYINVLNQTQFSQNNTVKHEPLQVIRSRNKQIVGNDKLGNFDVFPIRKICYIDRYGINVPSRESILCRVVFEGGKEESLEILTTDISKLVKKIMDRFTTAIINFSEPNAEKILEANFRLRTQNIPLTRRLFEAGWQIINGAHFYVHDSAILLPDFEVTTGRNLPFYTNWLQRDIGNVFIRATKLVNAKRTAYTLFLYSLMGVLFKLFEEAGYPPHFLLFLNGKTGSMKTTVAKILFTQLSDMKHRDMPRRIDADTINSFERAIVLSGRDTTLLIDDYAPAKTPQKKAEMQNRLEMVVRMVGDGATKSRSNAKLEDIQGAGVKGMVVITGEIQGKGTSSNLRCLYCTMKRSYANVENISWFQQKENEFAYTTAIMHFTEFLSWKWDEMLEYIMQTFPLERKNISEYVTERRLVDSAACLRITADIFEKFMVEYCDVDSFFISEMIKEMKNEVLLNACENVAMTQEESYSEMFIKGIHTLLITSKLRLYSGKIEAEKIGVFDGFEDAENLYFIPEVVYFKVMDFLEHSRQYLPLDLKDLVQLMCEDGMIKAHSNGSGKKTYYARINVQGGVKQKFLKISKKIFNAVVEGTFDNDSDKGGI